MSKKISCGSIIFYKDKFLIAKPTGQKDRWDIPKGQLDDNESHLDCAIRETYEETNLKLKKEQLIKDCNIYNYNKKKNLHIFMFEINEKPNNLKCNSYFELNEIEIPEMSDYKWISKSEICTYFNKNLYKVLSKIFKK